MTEDWARLAAFVRRARVDLGFPTTSAWATALGERGVGLKLKTLQRIENGHPVGENTRTTLEVELGLPEGAATRIARGEPVDATEADAPNDGQAISPDVFDLTPDQLIDLHDYAAGTIGYRFAAELLRWVGENRRRTAAPEVGAAQGTQRDAG